MIVDHNPPYVRAGQRLAARTLNQMMDARGQRRLRMNKIAYAQGSGLDVSQLTFSCSLSGSTVTIAAGVIMLGDVSYEVASDTVTLSGATEYVYLWHKKNHSSSGFEHMATVPTSAGDEWRWILCRYTGSGGVYTLAAIHHVGDVSEKLPMQ